MPWLSVSYLCVVKHLEARDCGTKERRIRGPQLTELRAAAVTDGLSQRLVRVRVRVWVWVRVRVRAAQHTIVVDVGELPYERQVVVGQARGREDLAGRAGRAGLGASGVVRGEQG